MNVQDPAVELAASEPAAGCAAHRTALRRVPGSSIYAFLEGRFGRGTRRVLASAFPLSRGLALGVVLYASAIAVSAALQRNS